MDNESDFDFNTLTREQLQHSVDSIDGSKWPKNPAAARAALDARVAGKSPEPLQSADPAGEARFTNLIGKILALLLVACAIFGVVNDDLWIPYWSRHRGPSVIHFHGAAAWVCALSIGVFASIPFLGGISDTDGLIIRPRFRYVSLIAVVLLLAAGVLEWPNGFA